MHRLLILKPSKTFPLQQLSQDDVFATKLKNGVK